ncbi:MAG TPA: hypothetical protein VL137_16800 [Polyangiaceae bacterium]|nr:hypothetical protein [Polyangiaceae bacterium]
MNDAASALGSNFGLIFVVVFLGIWLGANALVSVTGGWRALAQRYRTDLPVMGNVFRFRSARFRNFTNYNNCLTFGAAPQGLYVSVFWPFRISHPPLFIPWTEISGRRFTTYWWFERMELTFPRVPGVTIQLRRKLAEEIIGAANLPQALRLLHS